MSRRPTVNPVLSRELRQRVRGRRASVVLTLYLSVLVLAVGLMVWGIQRSTEAGSSATQGLGRTLFGSILFLVLGLVCFIVPGVAAGAVAGERERLTLVPLQVTLLTPGQLLRGKLLASLAFTTLLLVATLPILAVAYVLGGVTVLQIGGGLFFVLASAAFLGVISIWASTVLRRVQRATVVAYGIVGLLVVGTPIAYGVQFVATSNTSGDGERWESLLLLAPNPFLVTADALGHSGAEDGGGSPFTPSQEALRRRDERRQGFKEDVAAQEGVAFEVGPTTTAPFGFSGGMPGTVPAPQPLPPFAEGTAPVPFPTTTRAEGRVPAPPTTAVITHPTGRSTAPTLPPPVAPGATVLDPSGTGFGSGGGGFNGPPPGGRIIVSEPDFFGDPSGDFTDAGPIWAWMFGWWGLFGGAAYVHASRKLRLPSVDGVRP